MRLDKSAASRFEASLDKITRTLDPHLIGQNGYEDQDEMNQPPVSSYELDLDEVSKVSNSEATTVEPRYENSEVAADQHQRESGSRTADALNKDPDVEPDAGLCKCPCSSYLPLCGLKLTTPTTKKDQRRM